MDEVKDEYKAREGEMRASRPWRIAGGDSGECGSLPVGERNCQRFTLKGLRSRRSL